MEDYHSLNDKFYKWTKKHDVELTVVSHIPFYSNGNFNNPVHYDFVEFLIGPNVGKTWDKWLSKKDAEKLRNEWADVATCYVKAASGNFLYANEDALNKTDLRYAEWNWCNPTPRKFSAASRPGKQRKGKEAYEMVEVESKEGERREEKAGTGRSEIGNIGNGTAKGADAIANIVFVGRIRECGREKGGRPPPSSPAEGNRMQSKEASSSCGPASRESKQKDPFQREIGNTKGK